MVGQWLRGQEIGEWNGGGWNCHFGGTPNLQFPLALNKKTVDLERPKNGNSILHRSIPPFPALLNGATAAQTRGCESGVLRSCIARAPQDPLGKIQWCCHAISLQRRSSA